MHPVILSPHERHWERGPGPWVDPVIAVQCCLLHEQCHFLPRAINPRRKVEKEHFSTWPKEVMIMTGTLICWIPKQLPLFSSIWWVVHDCLSTSEIMLYVCVHTCVYVFVYIKVCMHEYVCVWRREDSLSCHFSGTNNFVLGDKVFHRAWGWPIRLACLPSQLRRYACVILPSTGTISTHQHTCFF